MIGFRSKPPKWYGAGLSKDPSQEVYLTTKGLAAMNAVPFGFKEAVGAELRRVAERSSGIDLGRIGDLIGGVIGGFTKSVSS